MRDRSIICGALGGAARAVVAGCGVSSQLEPAASKAGSGTSFLYLQTILLIWVVFSLPIFLSIHLIPVRRRIGGQAPCAGIPVIGREEPSRLGGFDMS